MKPERRVEIDNYPVESYRVATVVDGLEYPWGMARLPDGRRLITELKGNVRIVDTGGLHYDPQTGRLYQSEHGPYDGDEVNIIEPGENYGWPMATEGVNYPGTSISPHKKLEGVRAPINHWTPSSAPSGIVIYRGDAFPEFNGDLLVNSLAGQGVFRLDLEAGRLVNEQRLFHELGKRIRDIDIGEDGDLYLLTDHNPGQLLRIDAAITDRSGQ